MLGLDRNVFVLMLASAFALCVAPLVVFIGGIVGASLAPSHSLATLPVAAMVVGTAVSVVPVAKLMNRFGRKRIFQLGALYGSVMSLCAAYAIANESFWGFTLVILGLGGCLAIIQQYRFAAIESGVPERAGSAASIVLVGGLVAAFLGPEMVDMGRAFMDDFVGAFVILSFSNLIAFIILFQYDEPVITHEETVGESGRPLLAIIRQPLFLLAMLSSAVGYAVMSYIMTATPVSMHHIEAFSLDETKWVIQSHILAMYLPSFFSGYLIDRYGARSIMRGGLAIYVVCLLIALSGKHWLHYWSGLVALGLGWNLLFVAGTALLRESHRHVERFRVQGVNDFLVFGFQAIASLSSGVVIFGYGWNILVLAAIPMLVVLMFVMVWEARSRRLLMIAE